MSRAGTPARSATSTSRAEFEELGEPTTMTRSASARHLAHGLLAVGGGVADVVGRRRDDRRETLLAQLERHLLGLVDGEGRLDRVRDARLVRNRHRAGLLDAVDDEDPVSGLADGPDHFLVVVVAEQEHGAALLGVAADFLVHLGDQRAGGVDEAQPAVDRLRAHLRRDPVSGEDDPRAVGHLIELLDEDRAALLEILHDVSVVHDLAAHVDRCAEAFERRGHGVDRTLDTGAERARRGEQDLAGIGGRRPLLHQRREPAQRAQRRDARA